MVQDRADRIDDVVECRIFFPWENRIADLAGFDGSATVVER